MNLTSCNNCGIVLDKDQLNFTDKDDCYDTDGTMDTTKARWNGSGITPIIPCPVCTHAIWEDE